MFKENDVPFKLCLTVSAKLNTVDISWYNLETPNNGYILLTDNEPTVPFRKYELSVDDQLSYDTSAAQQPNDTTITSLHELRLKRILFTYGNRNTSALYSVKPSDKNGWVATSTIFNSDLLKSITKHTKCYGYWAVYLNNELNPVATTCTLAYATWMNDERENLKHFRFRDLFIVGSHDSGSYRINFDASHNETLVTKYALTQVNKLQAYKQFPELLLIIVIIMHNFNFTFSLE